MFPVNTIQRPNNGSMLGQRSRRWTNIEPTLGKCIMCAGLTVGQRQTSTESMHRVHRLCRRVGYMWRDVGAVLVYYRQRWPNTEPTSDCVGYMLLLVVARCPCGYTDTLRPDGGYIVLQYWHLASRGGGDSVAILTLCVPGGIPVALLTFSVFNLSILIVFSPYKNGNTGNDDVKKQCLSIKLTFIKLSPDMCIKSQEINTCYFLCKVYLLADILHSLGLIFVVTLTLCLPEFV